MIPAHQLSCFEHANGSIADDYFADADFSNRHIALPRSLGRASLKNRGSLLLRFRLEPNCTLASARLRYLSLYVDLLPIAGDLDHISVIGRRSKLRDERSAPMSISTRLKSLLDENKIPYSVMTHETAYTAQGVAATMQISGKELAKTVVL
jgi:hypothetical protein